MKEPGESCGKYARKSYLEIFDDIRIIKGPSNDTLRFTDMQAAVFVRSL